jgi:aspartate kinase
MLELASMGAKVLQTRSVEFAMKFGVPIHVRSSFHEGEGTWVVAEEEEMEKVIVRAVTYDRNEARVSVLGVPDQPGIAAQVFNTLADNGIVVDMIIQNAASMGELTDLTFTVPATDLQEAERLITELNQKLGAAGLRTDPGIAKVSVIGVGMRTHSGVAARTFRVLSEQNINIQMISTSEIKISVVIDDRYTELAVRSLHEAFGLDA